MREEQKKKAKGLQRNKKTFFVNDGRPPDTTNELLSPYKKMRKIGSRIHRLVEGLHHQAILCLQNKL